MTILPKHLNAMDVVSVLMFSLLANYILPLKIDFRSQFDFSQMLKLLFLSVSSVLFYQLVTHLKEIAAYSHAEYEAETSIEAQAMRSVVDRYRGYYKLQQLGIVSRFSLAVICGIAFFFVDPVIGLFN